MQPTVSAARAPVQPLVGRHRESPPDHPAPPVPHQQCKPFCVRCACASAKRPTRQSQLRGLRRPSPRNRALTRSCVCEQGLPVPRKTLSYRISKPSSRHLIRLELSDGSTCWCTRRRAIVIASFHPAMHLTPNGQVHRARTTALDPTDSFRCARSGATASSAARSVVDWFRKAIRAS